MTTDDAERAGEMLTLVRTARGVTQAELAQDAKMSQAALSKAEAGLKPLDADRLAAVADVLGVPVSRFFAGIPAGGLLSACAFHRKRSSLPVSDAKRIRAMLDLTRLQVEELVDPDAPPATVPLSPTVDTDLAPAEIARNVRHHMNHELALPDGPLPDLVAAIEALGAVVLVRDLGARRIDAIGSFPETHRPLFLLNASAPADRRRFTLAHELGHAIMHPVPTADQEAEADAFASELLMPTQVIRSELKNVALADLALLKRRWGTSMAALARKARDLGGIGEHDYKRLNIELSTAGYRLREPVEVAYEHPTLVAECITRQLRDGATARHLASAAHMRENEFRDLYMQEPA